MKWFDEVLIGLIWFLFVLSGLGFFIWFCVILMLRVQRALLS